MNKELLTSLALCCLVALAACSQEEVEAKVNAAGDQVAAAVEELKDLDLSKLSPEAIEEKAGSVAEMLGDQLEKIDDRVSAEKAKELAEPMVAALQKMKDAIGENMPDMDSLSGAVEALKAKLAEAGDDTKAVLQPLLDEIEQLLE